MTARDTYTFTYTADADPKNADYVVRTFGCDGGYFDNYVVKELSEFNNAYTGVRLDKVTAHIALNLIDFKVHNKKVDPSAETHLPISPAMEYLWHYNYDGTHSTISCKRSNVEDNCLTFVRKWPRSNRLKHRITWYFKPRIWYFLKEVKFEKLNTRNLVLQQGSSGKV